MKQIIFLIAVLFLVLVISNVAVSLVTLWSKKDLLTQTRAKLAQEQQENVLLKKSLQEANSSSFVEEQARDKLFMAKPGDIMVFLPTASSSGSLKQAEEAGKPNWLQWWDLFF